MTRRLLVRQDTQSPWIDNFSKGGWQIYISENSEVCQQGIACGWFRMLPSNTKVRSADNQRWENVT